MTANSLLNHRGQTGTALGDIPSGTIPIWCHLEQFDFQPWAGQCSKEAKVEENEKTEEDATKGGVEGGSANVLIQLQVGFSLRCQHPLLG